MFMMLTQYTIMVASGRCGPLVLTASGEEEVALLCRILARSGYDFSVTRDVPVQVVEPSA